jgi:hypothetical protein
MTADYTVSCHSSEYHFGFIWACVMIFVYPIGCPAYYFHLLHGIRHEILARDEDVTVESVDENAEISEEMRLTQEKLLSLKFLYESYHSRYWWWEIAETTQRLLLTGILVLIAQGSAIQIVVGALFTLSFLHLYARYEPFIDGFVLSIKIISYWQIFFVFWIALLIKADFPSISFHSLGICLVFTIFANFLIDLWKVIHWIFTSSHQNRQNSIVFTSSPFHLSPFPRPSVSDAKRQPSCFSETQTEMGRISSQGFVSSSSPFHLSPFSGSSPYPTQSQSQSEPQLPPHKDLDTSSL